MATKKSKRGPATAVPCPSCGAKNDFTQLGVSPDKGMVVSCEVVDKVTGEKKGGCGRAMRVIRVRAIPVVWVQAHSKPVPTEFAAHEASCARHMCAHDDLTPMHCGACAEDGDMFVVHHCKQHRKDAIVSMRAHASQEHIQEEHGG